MWVRVLKKFIRTPSRMIAAIGQPLLYLLALGNGLGGTFRTAEQGSYFQFLVPGMIGMTIIFASMFNGMQIIWDRQFGFLKVTLVAPAPRIAVMLGRTFGGASVATVQGCLVFALTLLLGFQPASWIAIIPAILVMFLVAALFSALGIAVASFVADIQGFQLVMNLLVMPLFFLSGALFPLGDVPFLLHLLAVVDPLSYGVDGLRAVLTARSQFGIVIDLAMLFVIAFVLLGLGGHCFAKLQV
jgi:ABC-2 type transport system permease protein